MDSDRVADIVSELEPARVLLVGDAHALAVALRARGIAVTEQAAWPEWPRYDVVIWRPDEAAVARAPLAPAGILRMTKGNVIVITAVPASAWSEPFAAAGFSQDEHFAPGAPGVLRFRKARRAGTDADALRIELGRRLEQLDGLYRLLDDKNRLITTLRRDLAAVHSTLGWRSLERLRLLAARATAIPLVRGGYAAARRTLEVLIEEGPKEVLLKTGHKLGLALRGRDFRVQARRPVPRDLNAQYQVWLARQQPPDAEQPAVRTALERLATGPLVSVLVALETPEVGLLERALETLRGQGYARWELCVAVSAGVRAALKSEIDTMEIAESRLRVCVAEGDEPTLADALRVATGPLLGVLDPHDLLASDALLELVGCLEGDAATDVVYSDEDALDTDGRRTDPFFKPEWSPDLLLSTNYLGRFALVRRRLADAVGGIRPEPGLAAAYDLWLRVTETTTAVTRVPKVLYHRSPRAASVASVGEWERLVMRERQAVADAMRRRGLEGEVEAIAVPFATPPVFASRLRVRGRPLISIVIPTRDKRHLLEQTIRSVRERTSYDRYEILVLDNDSREPETLRFLEDLRPPCRLFRWPGTFNFSAINNFGARNAEGEHLLFLNNDVEVLRPDWLTALLEHSQRPDVGAVGAKLLYPDGRIQHAGVVVGVSGAAVHAFRLWPGEPDGSPRLADLVRDCSAVTAACMMVPRDVFEQLGGFDEALRVVFQDVDLCLRIRALGRLVVYTPFALLTHYEGASRGRLHPTPDQKLFQQRWRRVLERTDPYYNPNLTDTRDDWSLRI